MAKLKGTLSLIQLRALWFVRGEGIHSVTEFLQQPSSVSPAWGMSPAWSYDKGARAPRKWPQQVAQGQGKHPGPRPWRPESESQLCPRQPSPQSP